MTRVLFTHFLKWKAEMLEADWLLCIELSLAFCFPGYRWELPRDEGGRQEAHF